MKKWIIFLVVFAIFLGLDIYTKQLALQHLEIHQTEQLLGFIPITLTFNTGGGFSLSFGESSRYIFSGISILVFIVLLVVYAKTPTRQAIRLVSIMLIASGAIGNLIDRLRWDLGVVDFIGPIDLGFMLWPIFNVADSAVSVGGVLLLISLWLEEPKKAPELAHDDVGLKQQGDHEVAP